MNICVVGTGYVGLVTGVVFSDLGNDVVCVDLNEDKIASLNRGEMPIYEPGLEEMAVRNVAEGRLSYTTALPQAVRRAEVIFIAVGTPPKPSGETDLAQVEGVAREIALAMNGYKVIVTKSTVPVGTGDLVRNVILQNQPAPLPFDVVSNPEFLREGSAISDTLRPDRIVIGAPSQNAAMKILELYAPLERPMILTDVASAEMIKYASNAFLAAKISFANSIANLCETVGADVQQVTKGMGLDSRIGSAFLHAGIGWGGSCFGADETVFTVGGDGQTETRRFDELFDSCPARYEDKGASVAVPPPGLSVLAYDLETGKPAVAPVSVLTRRAYTGDMIMLRTAMGRTLRVTADHPVVIEGDAAQTAPFVIKTAATVSPGERLLALADLPALAPAPAILDLIALLENTPLEADVHVTTDDGDAFTRAYETFARHVPASLLRYPHEIKRHNRMPLRVYRHLTNLGLLSDIKPESLLLYTAAANKIQARIPLNEGFARLLGYYSAEGCITKDMGRAGARRERVLFSFHENETEYIEDVRGVLTSIGLRFIERRSPGARSTITSSRIFAFLLRDVLKCGVRSEDKRVPAGLLNLPEGCRRAFVWGAFRGDGSVTPVQNGRNLYLDWATVSRPLADGMALVLQSLGVVASYKSKWMNKSTRPAYFLRVSGQAQIADFRDAFGDKRRDLINNTLAGYQRAIRQHGFERRSADSVVLLTVKSVTREPMVSENVYSMETATETLIASSGLVAHNCFPKDVRSLLHTAQARDCPFPLLDATIQTNDDQPKRFVREMERKLGGFEGRKIAVWGLAFKANTDDMRDAKSVDIIAALLAGGADVTAFDPIAMDNARRIFPQIGYAKSAYEAATGADALVVVTEWNEFKQINLDRLKGVMAGAHLFDGRNLYDPAKMKRAGFDYVCVGRGTYPGATGPSGPGRAADAGAAK